MPLKLKIVYAWTLFLTAVKAFISISGVIVYGLYNYKSLNDNKPSTELELIYELTMRSVYWSGDLLICLSLLYLFYCQALTKQAIDAKNQRMVTDSIFKKETD
jgi:hypothetical protein